MSVGLLSTTQAMIKGFLESRIGRDLGEAFAELLWRNLKPTLAKDEMPHPLRPESSRYFITGSNKPMPGKCWCKPAAPFCCAPLLLCPNKPAEVVGRDVQLRLCDRYHGWASDVRCQDRACFSLPSLAPEFLRWCTALPRALRINTALNPLMLDRIMMEVAKSEDNPSTIIEYTNLIANILEEVWYPHREHGCFWLPEIHGILRYSYEDGLADCVSHVTEALAIVASRRIGMFR